MKNKKWTKEDEDYLRDNYLLKSNKEMAKEIARTEVSVRGRLNILNLRRNKFAKYVKWKESEIKMLKKNYLHKSNQQLATMLGRSSGTISTRMNKIGLKRPKGLGHSIFTNKNRKPHLYKGKTLVEMVGYERAKEIGLKISKANKGKNAGKNNPMYGMKGELCPSWKGGISFVEYGLACTKLFKEEIRERDNYCCAMCNKPQEEQKEKLSVHHIDYIKINTVIQNCVSLCRGCHTLTNQNRTKWKTFFQALLKERYGYEYSEDQKVILDIN